MVYLSHGVSRLEPLGVGVDLFFVLSGFLIGRIYFRSQKEKDFSIWRFWRSRWWRTLPPYYAALLLYFCVSLKFSGNSVNWRYLFFLQNYTGVTGFGPSWSLCVEEHFYLALPLLGWLVQKVLGRRSFLWLLPLAALLPLSLRVGYVLLWGALPRDWYWMTHFHSEGLVLGLFLAYLFVYYQPLWAKARPVALALSVIPFPLFFWQLSRRPSGTALNVTIFLLWALGFSGWVRVVYDLAWEPVTSAARLIKESIHGLALCSYSVYLVHVLFFSDVRDLLNRWPHGLYKSAFIMSLTFVLSLVFYFLIERPSIITRDRYLKRDVPIVLSPVQAASVAATLVD